jgi:hypothetical protein
MGFDFAELDRRWRETLKGPPEAGDAPAEAKTEAEAKTAAAPAQSAPAPDAKPDPEEPADAPLKAEIETLLRRMETAINAHDQEGYLAAVDHSDPVFTTEQKAWAKDLGRTPPERAGLTIEDEPARAEDGAATARVKWTWRMPGRNERTVTLPSRFVQSGAGWLYSGEQWTVLEREGVRVMYLTPNMKAVAEQVIEIFPPIRRHVHEGFELTEHKPLTDRVQEVKLYPSMKHLQHSIYLSYEDSLGGWNEPGESIKLLARANSSGNYLKVVLAHEYGHVASFELGPKANDMPWWILEGIAELSAEKYSGGTRGVNRIVRGWAAVGQLIEWERLADFHGEAAEHSSHVYTQGHHMMSYITERFGRPRCNQWMRAMATGSAMDQATRDVLGISFAELDEQWRESLVEETKPEEKKAEAAEEPALSK